MVSSVRVMGSSSTLPAFRISTPSPSWGRTGFKIFLEDFLGIVVPLYSETHSFRHRYRDATSLMEEGFSCRRESFPLYQKAPSVRGCLRSRLGEFILAHIQIVQILGAVLRRCAPCGRRGCRPAAGRTPGPSRIDIGGQHLDKAAGLRVHGGQPHHLGVVLAQAFGALDGVLFARRSPPGRSPSPARCRQSRCCPWC